MPVDPGAVLQGFLDKFLVDHRDSTLGVAVSGGGDSMALLHMTVAWSRARASRLIAATVNHGLRAEAADEARMVAQACAGLGVPHRTLMWNGWTGTGNLQDAARKARQSLLREWAGAERLDAVLLGHTADDQAETVLMRLARGSGVDGLSGMDAVDRTGLFLRPLLDLSRQDLRDWLQDRGIGWAEDPSNDDLRFDRVKARRMLGTLAPLGLTPARLIETADHMARARATLWQAAAGFAVLHVRAEAGDLLVDDAALDLSVGDVPGRVLAAAIQWIGNSPYRPRHEALTETAAALRRREARTLGGVWLQPESGGARLSREPVAAQQPVPLTGHEVIWDGRWRVSFGQVTLDGDWTVGALGEAGLIACPNWREAGLPRTSLLASPAVWQGDRLRAAPIAGWPNGVQASLCLPFDRFIVSH